VVRLRGAQGFLALTALPGTQSLMGCRDGDDHFVTLDSHCAGKTVLGSNGRIWTQPQADLPNRALYSCTIRAERYTSLDPACEGYTVGPLLGYVLTAVPTDPPVFG
jgi:hypothetical protein